jgi:hypothetical protein
VQWVDDDYSLVAAEFAEIAACHAGGFWGVAGRLMALPGLRQLAGVADRLVAKYRHQLPGGTPACKLP